MTSLLQQAFEKAQALPKEEQDAIAAILIEEMASEQRWQESLARSRDVLDRLAVEAREEYRQGAPWTLPTCYEVPGDRTFSKTAGGIAAGACK